MQIEVLGQGPALVLIHGWAMHGGIFAPLTRRLVERFEVHLVDLPGHGHSRDDEARCYPLDCARALLTRVPRALWVGWSLGGLVALRAAQAEPGKVRALGLIASNPRFVLGDDWPHGVAHEVFAQFGAGLRGDWRRTLERFLALEAHGSARAQAELRELKAQLFERGEPSLAALECGLDALDRSDLRDVLKQLAMPSLWIAGRRDRLVPPAAMRWAAEQARGDFLEISAGHAPFLSHADEVAAALVALDEA
jgi:pimeloyl-[acyl-carrier protein] methyl ester esterase